MQRRSIPVRKLAIADKRRSTERGPGNITGRKFSKMPVLITRIDEVENETLSQPEEDVDYVYMKRTDQLPTKLRLPAMQSYAAQYAAMLCYEEKVRQRLKDIDDSPEDVHRNLTPPLATMESHRLDRSMLWHSSHVPVTNRFHRTVSRYDGVSSRADASRRSVVRASFAQTASRVELRTRNSVFSEMRESKIIESAVKQPVIPEFKHKQMVTYQLENAMDILDALDAAEGEHHLTSKRYTKIGDPLRAYKTWTKVWPALFSFSDREIAPTAVSQARMTYADMRLEASQV